MLLLVMTANTLDAGAGLSTHTSIVQVLDLGLTPHHHYNFHFILRKPRPMGLIMQLCG